MPIRVTCPSCQQQSTAPDKLGGQTRRCPRCGADMLIPLPMTSPEPKPAPTPEHKPSEGNPFTPPKKQEDHSELIDMTAMVDIVFFLLIYFLVTSFVAMSAAIRAPLTEGRSASNSSAASLPDSQTLTVRIDADDAVWIDQEPVFGSRDVYARLRASQLETGAEKLRIAASPEATHGKLVMVLDAGLSAKFKTAQVGLEETQ